jgi:uncharacterized protein (DUF1778 family)
MPKTLTIRVNEDTYTVFAKHAKAENRTLANFIEHAVKVHIREQEFADDLEMAEILANEQLVARMKKGSRDGKRRKGGLVG